jgi:hypothetical protein
MASSEYDLVDVEQDYRERVLGYRVNEDEVCSVLVKAILQVC